jgi:hypothetical protein
MNWARYFEPLLRKISHEIVRDSAELTQMQRSDFSTIMKFVNKSYQRICDLSCDFVSNSLKGYDLICKNSSKNNVFNSDYNANISNNQENKVVIYPIDGVVNFARGLKNFSFMMFVFQEDEEKLFDLQFAMIYNPLTFEILSIDKADLYVSKFKGFKVNFGKNKANLEEYLIYSNNISLLNPLNDLDRKPSFVCHDSITSALVAFFNGQIDLLVLDKNSITKELLCFLERSTAYLSSHEDALFVCSSQYVGKTFREIYSKINIV